MIQEPNDSREPRARLATAVLFAGPPALVLIVVLIAGGMGLVRARLSKPAPKPAAVREVAVNDRSVHVRSIAGGTHRPALEGIRLGQAAARLRGKKAFVFSRTLHSASIREAVASSEATVVRATESTQTSGAYFLRIDEPTSTGPAWSDRYWWYPEHWETVKVDGATHCFDCHNETNCSSCHVRNSGG